MFWIILIVLLISLLVCFVDINPASNFEGAPSKFEAGFISTKHTNKEINNTIRIIQNILKKGI